MIDNNVFNKVVNDILLQVKPVYLRKQIATEFLDLITRMQEEKSRPKKILANRVYADTTLMSMTKAELIEHIRILEHNWSAAEETLANSVKNSEQIFYEQKEEIETLKSELAKELKEHEAFTLQTKETVNNLMDELYQRGFSDGCDYETKIEDLAKVNEELQKQVDDLKFDKELLQKLLDKREKDTAKKFTDLVEFHSIARMNDGVEYFTISALGLKEILTEEFGFKYYELDGVEVE